MIKYELQYSDSFWKDIKNVINWYDGISPHLTDRFLEAFWFTEARIKTNPKAFIKVTLTGFRRILLKKFPYKIFFNVKDNTVFVVALIHVSRSNRYIKKRLK